MGIFKDEYAKQAIEMIQEKIDEYLADIKDAFGHSRDENGMSLIDLGLKVRIHEIATGRHEMTASISIRPVTISSKTKIIIDDQQLGLFRQPSGPGPGGVVNYGGPKPV